MVSKLRVGEKRLERTQVRRVLIVGVMLALGGIGFLLGRSMVGQQQAKAPAPTDLEPDVTQRIKEFRRVKVKDGRKEWELTAQQAEFFTEQGEVAITGPKLAFYGGEGRDVEVKGRDGRVFLTNGDVQRIELSGGIDVTVGDYFVETDSAVYFQNINSIAAPGEVRLKGSDIALTGQAMLLELGSQRVLFRNGVTTRFERSREAMGGGAGHAAAKPVPAP